MTEELLKQADEEVAVLLEASEAFDMLNIEPKTGKRLAKLIKTLADELREREWQDISSMPRDVEVDTCGTFLRKRDGGVEIQIRHAGDYVSASTVYPLKKTYYDYNGVIGTYTRTHWKLAPVLPKEKE